MAALNVFRIAGAASAVALVADVGYIQFVDATCEGASGVEGDMVRDLFDQYIPSPWDDLVRVVALSLAALGAVATVVDAMCPETLTRVVYGRPAGTLVASTTSAL
jgi:hypothetical protein